MEELITSKLAALSLPNDEDTCEFVLGIVNEETIELADKKSAILGMLDAEEDVTVGASVDELLEAAGALWEETLEKEREEEEARLEAAREAAAAKLGKKVLTPEEEAARKADLLKTYGYVEEDEEPSPNEKAKPEADSDAPFVDPRTLSKKARRKAEAGMDLYMQPNMNAAIVKGAEAQKRKDSAAAAAAKRERDKGDLKKQKDDAAKKLADKQKRAQKGERKA